MLKKWLLLFAHAPFALIAQQQVPSDSTMISGIYNQILASGNCYEDLRYLCKNIGHRIAGSDAAQRAIDWGKSTLEAMHPDTVYLEPVNVPHWSRGAVETASYTEPGSGLMCKPSLAALGGSVGTNGPIKAQVVEVKSFEELRALEKNFVKGKIVFFNKAMDPLLINTGAAYGGAYPIRSDGPTEAAKMGAVACLIRSLTLADDDYAHTGGTHYNDSLPKIPAAALSSVASRKLSSHLKSDPSLLFTLELGCVDFGRTWQSNVIAEIRGSEFPDEYITIGGHLDSWDIGEGAHDDGAGIVQTIEAMRTLIAIGYKPRHSIRTVLFINEEFGNDGGETYARNCKNKGLVHVAAIESDGGGFSPRGFNCEVNDAQYGLLQSWLPLMETYNLHILRRGGSGVDIRPLKDERVALFGLNVDGQRYFDYHHSNNDIFENVNKRELELGAAAIASLVYLIDQTGIPANP